MSNSVQRMAKAGENIRKLGFCMAAVFAGMLVAFAALVVYVIWYAVANVASVDSFGVVTLLDGVHRYPKRTVPGTRRGYFACRSVWDQP